MHPPNPGPGALARLLTGAHKTNRRLKTWVRSQTISVASIFGSSPYRLSQRYRGSA